MRAFVCARADRLSPNYPRAAFWGGQALDYAGPYLQTGCTGSCAGIYTARFDTVKAGVICAQ